VPKRGSDCKSGAAGSAGVAGWDEVSRYKRGMPMEAKSAQDTGSARARLLAAILEGEATGRPARIVAEPLKRLQ